MGGCACGGTEHPYRWLNLPCLEDRDPVIVAGPQVHGGPSRRCRSRSRCRWRWRVAAIQKTHIRTVRCERAFWPRRPLEIRIRSGTRQPGAIDFGAVAGERAPESCRSDGDGDGYGHEVPHTTYRLPRTVLLSSFFFSFFTFFLFSAAFFLFSSFIFDWSVPFVLCMCHVSV